MALTLRSNGNNPINIVSASWFNDFYNLLTGVMNDQPVSLKYVPASGTTPALTLTSKAGNPLLKGFEPDGVTQAFLVDENGNLSALGQLSFGAGVGGNLSHIDWDPTNHINVYWAPQSGATALGHTFVTWSGSAQVNALSIGGNLAGALAYFDNSGNLTIGPGGGTVLTASAVGAGFGQFYWHSKDNTTPEFSWTMDSRPNPALAMQIARQNVNGFTFLDIFHIDLFGNITTPAGAGIPTTRNGSALSVPIFTGTTTPTSPPTGSIWIKA